MRTVTSPIDGQQIPVTKDLNVQPLTFLGKELKTPSGTVMNDRWIYVNMPGYGMHSINVYRAHYCQKMYMSEITIQYSIGEKKLMDKDLQKFVDQVSDKIVFQKYGKWYRVYLRKRSNRTFTIDKVVPYNWTVNPNMMVGGRYAHQCCLDWRSAFYVR